MLLRHTTKEITERKALSVNPAKTCQPIGAMLAALGLHNCLPHSHGSQGCCAYHRSTLSRHYREPIMAGTSSFTEGASVFGGQSNLLQAITNIFTIYNPDVIAVHSTCLSETIGDDLNQIVIKARKDNKIPEGKYIIFASTPSYVGSHVTGFSSMVKAMVNQISEKTDKPKQQINIIPGWVEPSDMAELKRITREMGIPTVMFPDTSGVLDTPQTGKYKMFPKGGTTIDDLKSTGDSIATIALGKVCSGDAAKELDRKHKVPCEIIDLPIGVKGTDRFIEALRSAAGVSVPDSINDERGRLVDMITDMQQYFYHKKFAIFGDPDQLVAMTEFLTDLNMIPSYIITGTANSRGKKFEDRIYEILGEDYPNTKVMVSDMYMLHQLIKNESVDLLIGNTYGKYIARDEDIPFLRFGFPILDRVGHQYFPSVGYKGAMRIMERILTLLMDRQDRDADEETFELVM